MAVPMIAGAALRKMLSYSNDFGIDRGALLASLGIDPAVVDDPDARLPVATIHAAWDAIVATVARADGAVVAAEHYAPGDYGLVGFVVMTSATLDEAFGHFVRYVGLWTDEPKFWREGAAVRVEYRHAFADGPGKRIGIEAAFTEILQGARLVSQLRIVPGAVRIAHPAPQDVRAHEAFFGCKVEFAARDNALVFRAEDLARALPRADAQLGAFIRAAANQALARRDVDTGSLLEQTRSIVAEDLARGVPSVEDVARRLAISSRTLRRRLEDLGTSFRELVDATRADLARSYIRDRRMPLAEVAFMLGFSEPSTFHRAFKRWTNVTPAAWRASRS